MDYQSFQQEKQNFMAQPFGYKEAAINELTAIDDTHYSIGGTVVELSQSVADDMDHHYGIMPQQGKNARKTFGDMGITHLRNFLGQAGKQDKRHLILVADTSQRQVTRVFQTKEHLIPPTSFFDFAELFMDQNGYEPEALEYDIGTEISLRMRPNNPTYLPFAPDDEFMSNGLWLRWNPVEISFGNYYERLICSNGATQISTHQMMHANSLDDSSISRLLAINSDNFVLKHNTNVMIENARLAMKTPASVHELGLASRAMHLLGVEDEVVKIVPFQENYSRYEQAGYPTDAASQRRSISNITVWELFNRMTYFASHNEIWDTKNLNRSLLMSKSTDLLNQKRDIYEFNNIY